jgi:protein-disulfide isomerase
MAFRILTPFLCVAFIALGCGAQEPPTPATNDVAAPAEPATSDGDDGANALAARLGDETISVAELDAWIRDDLFKRASQTETDLFELRTQSLDRMATEQVLEQAAAARNQSTEDHVIAEVNAQGEISDEEIAAFYDERKDSMPGTLEELTPQIREYLRMVRGAEYAKKLRTETGFTILLEQPRIEMAADGPSRGPDDAAVTIIEFSDFQCPFCSRALPVIDEILERYPNDVRIVYRHLPLDRIHSRARPAAEASLCADDQGKFWPYHDQVFTNAKTLTDEDLKRFAEAAELDVAAFEQCVAARSFKQKVQQDVDAAAAAGISSTPAFLVNGILLGGAKPVEQFVTIIDAELANSKADEDES